MLKFGKGVPPPAKLEDIIDDLCENEKIKYSDNTTDIITFSRAGLTAQQKSSLTPSYPQGSTSLDVDLIYQINSYDADKNLTKTQLFVLSCVKKNDGFIYGVYFDVFNQQSFEIDQLIKSPQPIQLSSTAQLITSNYLEVYNNVLGTTFILGLSTKNEQTYASLQYADKSHYFYENLSPNGIENPNLPKTSLTGLSKNLLSVKSNTC
jgi:hypothetical protein